ncbi:Chaperone protein DnaJ [Rosistilla oblonga]|uniref:Chaperone protein DnaJ n=2 Tax=Rosistilla oblonga TaxID=2527990 RepID=A0A518IZK5_9BACT|nr:molecular chaperone DnaJ [Rosistilla oblonga]QDV13339.1 Chaperone protein DnaJ [Rosistilla oblonga]QDV58465.1 Chaperone protein DnaJ [Rosistilla oblonga]
MAEKRDYYELLSVSKEAGKVEIDRAYRRLAIKYHPDSNRDDEDAVERFKEISEAYEVLSDQEKRARYDQYGHAGLGGGGPQFNDVEDIFEAFGDMFGGSVFGDMFGGGRGGGRRRRARRGGDVRCDVTLTLEEAASGVRKEVKFRRRVACTDCDGSGAAKGSEPQPCVACGGVGQVIQSAGILRVQTSCPHCGGAGKVIRDPCQSCRGQGLEERQVSLDVDIPAGVDDGMRVRITGEGEASPDGGPPGDAYCFVQVIEHALFQRDGSNLILKLPIGYSQAVLGAELDVPTLDGRETLTIQKGTRSGEVYRLRGRGMPDPRGGRRGDLLVQTFIEVPKKVNEKQEKLLRQLAELDEEHVMPERKSFLDKIKTFFEPEESDA